MDEGVDAGEGDDGELFGRKGVALLEKE